MKKILLVNSILLFLTNSLVFAETWVCSEVLENSTPPNRIQQVTYRRSGDHFMWKNVRNKDEEKAIIAYEDEKLLFLYTLSTVFNEYFYPIMIDKETGSFRLFVLSVEKSYPEHYGSCVEVE